MTDRLKRKSLPSFRACDNASVTTVQPKKAQKHHSSKPPIPSAPVEIDLTENPDLATGKALKRMRRESVILPTEVLIDTEVYVDEFCAYSSAELCLPSSFDYGQFV